MKKLIVVLSMITCLFGMTACGSEKTYTEYEQTKLDGACQLTDMYYFDAIQVFAENQETFSDYTNAELADTFTGQCEYIQNYYAQMGGSSDFNFETSGSVLKSAFASYQAAIEIMGQITDKGDAKAEISGDTIIVTVPVVGEKKNAEVELIYSNDYFLELQSYAVNVNYSFGETMAKAGQNTLVGICTVFVMLILISFIISLFQYIPKIQESFAKKKESPKAEAIEKAVAQIVETEEASVSEDLSDDLELVAVISAAIATYEGSSAADGFVVRSIRKVNRR